MVAKLLVPLAVSGTLIVAGCGSSGQTASSVSETIGLGSSQAASVANSRAAHLPEARRYIANRLHGAPLTRHTSRPASGLADNEGPDKPRTAHALSERTFRVRLTGPSARHGGTTGPNVALVRLLPATRQVCWKFGKLPTVLVRTAAFGRVRMALRPETASIHQGSKRANGPVVVPLYARYAPAGCTVVAPVVLNSIIAAPHLYYLSLGSATTPGALRSQL